MATCVAVLIGFFRIPTVSNANLKLFGLRILPMRIFQKIVALNKNIKHSVYTNLQMIILTLELLYIILIIFQMNHYVYKHEHLVKKYERWFY